MSGSVVPFPKTSIDDDNDAPLDTAKATITIDEHGLTNIEIPSSRPRKIRKPKPNAGDFHRNLAEDMDPLALQALAAYLIEGIEADEQDRAEWEQTANRTASYLGVKLNDPLSEPASDGTVFQGVATCMLEAVTKMWSTSYAELLPAAGPVKTKRQAVVPAGEDQAQPGQMPQSPSDRSGDNLAEALEEDLNWYLTTKDRGYYPDFSKMIMMRNLIGISFREIYRCPIKRMPVSRMIMAQDLIVQGDPADLTEGGRVTARKKVRQSTMRRMMMAGEYLDIALVSPQGETSETDLVIGQTQGVNPTPSLPRDFEHTIYECCCELGSGTNHDLYGSLDLLDLDENGEDVGYPLPYRVTMDRDSRTVLAIRRNWKQRDPDHKVRERFVKYGFIPAFGFYDWGLIHLVGNPTQGATMLQRSGVDASMLANFPAWAIMQGPASKMENTVFRPGPGQVVKVPATGAAKITDVLMAWPYKEASPQSMALAEKLESDVKSLAGIIDLPVGEGRIGNLPVGTIMSYIESISMVPGAVHKADHAAQAREFELLRELIAEEPEVLWRGNPTPARKWQAAEEVMSPDVSPQADPNTPSAVHRLAKIQGVVTLAGLPQFQGIPDQRKIWGWSVEALVGADAAPYTLPPQAPPPPQPDPRIAAAQIKAQSQQQSDQAKLQEAQIDHQAKMAELAVQSSDKAQDRQAANAREAMKAGTKHTEIGANMASDAIGHAQAEKQTALSAALKPVEPPEPPDEGSGLGAGSV